jgi:putative endonuclease
MLVLEQHYDISFAIAREKQLKAGERKWKLALIEKENPAWRDLQDDLLLPRHLRRDDLWKGNA